MFDVVIENFVEKDVEEENDWICFFFIGWFNVGKFLFVNVILGENWVIVLDMVGMICDVINIQFMVKDGCEFMMVDMVGIKKKGKFYENIECYVLMCLMWVIDDFDVVLVVLNVEEGIWEFDKYIVGYVYEVGWVVIIVVNKWDMILDWD